MSIERVTSIHRTDWSDPTYNCMVINDHEDGEFDILKECGQNHDEMIDWSQCPVASRWVLVRDAVPN